MTAITAPTTTRSMNFSRLSVAWNVLGALLIYSTSSGISWGEFSFPPADYQLPLFLSVVLAYSLSMWAVPKLWNFPGANVVSLTIVTASCSFLTATAFLAAGRFYYSRSLLLCAYGFTVVWQIACARLFRNPISSVAVVPGGLSHELLGVADENRWVEIDSPALPVGAEAVVVDLQADHRSEWLHFLGDCVLNRIPVFHAASAFEMLTGRISIPHHGPKLIQEFSGRSLYHEGRGFLERLLVLVAAPVLIPVCAVVAFAVRVDSSGPVIFWQTRVGKGGRPFRMAKFRSMKMDSERGGAQFAKENDSRVTRLGRVLRKYRLDEIPQLWNVLRGEMSLIGPRPEQLSFVEQFKKEIPLYSFRHTIRPGLTGWAQVQSGYAADANATRLKLEYDLYYVKHASAWLDLVIVMRTIKTVFSGFGAR